jgi:hypothetical protein
MPQNGRMKVPRISGSGSGGGGSGDSTAPSNDPPVMCTSCNTNPDPITITGHPINSLLYDFFTSSDFLLFIVFLVVGLLMLTLKILYEVRSQLDLVLHLKWGRRARVVM